jgi:hypothetical protein
MIVVPPRGRRADERINQFAASPARRAPSAAALGGRQSIGQAAGRPLERIEYLARTVPSQKCGPVGTAVTHWRPVALAALVLMAFVLVLMGRPHRIVDK